jgi:hypothetical protein
MKHKQGTARDQISFSSFEDRISRDNPARFIEVFSGKIDLEKIGFSVKTLQKEGRPSFESSLFVRLYLYGYLNGLRSSRKLEKECYLLGFFRWCCVCPYLLLSWCVCLAALLQLWFCVWACANCKCAAKCVGFMLVQKV